jgi:hypothetical protein
MRQAIVSPANPITAAIRRIRLLSCKDNTAAARKKFDFARPRHSGRSDGLDSKERV